MRACAALADHGVEHVRLAGLGCGAGQEHKGGTPLPCPVISLEGLAEPDRGGCGMSCLAELVPVHAEDGREELLVAKVPGDASRLLHGCRVIPVIDRGRGVSDGGMPDAVVGNEDEQEVGVNVGGCACEAAQASLAGLKRPAGAGGVDCGLGVDLAVPGNVVIGDERPAEVVV
jgi:hypothetical protein